MCAIEFVQIPMAVNLPLDAPYNIAEVCVTCRPAQARLLGCCACSVGHAQTSQGNAKVVGHFIKAFPILPTPLPPLGAGAVRSDGDPHGDPGFQWWLCVRGHSGRRGAHRVHGGAAHPRVRHSAL